nr:MAG TPA: hypothetical protein [Caudoviricetes sp.]
MTNEEFRKSLSKEQLRFLQDEYKESLSEVKEALDGCRWLSYRDRVEYVCVSLSIASVYKYLLETNCLDIIFDEYDERYRNM